MSWRRAVLLAAYPLLTSPAMAQSPPPQPPLTVYVDRVGRQVYLLDAQGEVLHQEAVGVGRGGQGTKVSMGDLITPTGTFTVDLVLSAAGSHNAVSPEILERAAVEPVYLQLLQGEPGLAGLFANMNRIDFDGDGQPDGAYGSAYIGLDGAGAVVTGPKLRRYRDGTIYWFSIALHGTPDPTNLGAANSGGCVHLSAGLLDRLLGEGHLTLGSVVTIGEGPPP